MPCTVSLHRWPPRAALLLLAVLPCSVHAQATSAVTLAPAAPTGSTQLALFVHWIVETPPLYGVAFGSEQRARPTHVQIAIGRHRGVLQRWILSGAADHGWRFTHGPAHELHAFAGLHATFDRRTDDVLLRVPLGVRAEALLDAGAVVVAPVLAAGVAGGATVADGWHGYGGGFAEGGMRLAVAGFWAQGSALVEDQWAGPGADAAPPRARYTLRFGYVPRRRN